MSQGSAFSPESAAAGNWPQWRGPDGSGISNEKNLPSEWSPTKNIKWKTAIDGRAHSSPIVWGNRVFLTTAVEGAEVPGAKAVKHMLDDKEFVHPDSIGANQQTHFQSDLPRSRFRQDRLAGDCMGRHALRRSSPQEFLCRFDAGNRRQAGLCVLRHRRSLCLRLQRQARVESASRKHRHSRHGNRQRRRSSSTIS